MVLLGGDFALPVQAQLWLLHHKGRHSSTLGSRLGMLLCFVWYVASFPTQEPSCPTDLVSCSGGAWPEIQMLKLLVAICFKTLSLQAPDLKKIWIFKGAKIWITFIATTSCTWSEKDKHTEGRGTGDGPQMLWCKGMLVPNAYSTLLSAPRATRTCRLTVPPLTHPRSHKGQQELTVLRDSDGRMAVSLELS